MDYMDEVSVSGLVNDEPKDKKNETVYERIPNKAFDSEYMTEYVREVKFLASKGIRYTFVKRTPDYNIKQYKYTKTPELFVALAEFYFMVNTERSYNKLNKLLANKATLSKEAEKEVVDSMLAGGSNG